jgi:hypothetical protein
MRVGVAPKRVYRHLDPSSEAQYPQEHYVGVAYKQHEAELKGICAWFRSAPSHQTFGVGSCTRSLSWGLMRLDLRNPSRDSRQHSSMKISRQGLLGPLLI